MYLTIYLLIWAILAISLGVLTAYRITIARGRYTVLHLPESERGLVSKEIVFTKQLGHIDSWGKALTITLTAYTAIFLLVWVLYLVWQI